MKDCPKCGRRMSVEEPDDPKMAYKNECTNCGYSEDIAHDKYKGDQ